MDNGAVGVFVHNNYIHDFGFAGIRCGHLMSSQGHCMMTRIYRNHVYKSQPKADDSGGIYYNTHWINPGEGCYRRLECTTCGRSALVREEFIHRM